MTGREYFLKYGFMLRNSTADEINEMILEELQKLPLEGLRELALLLIKGLYQISGYVHHQARVQGIARLAEEEGNPHMDHIFNLALLHTIKKTTDKMTPEDVEEFIQSYYQSDEGFGLTGAGKLVKPDTQGTS